MKNFTLEELKEYNGKDGAKTFVAYSSLSSLTEGKDIVTYNMVNNILADEVEHEEDLQSLYDDIKGFMDSFKA
jgi:ferritin-like protein